MNIKQIIQDYFSFSRNERKGITVLLILIFLLAVINKVLFYFETPAKIDTVLLDSCGLQLGNFSDSISRQPTEQKLFRFNPNTIDSITLLSLDLPESVKFNLLKFRKKGGELHSVSDFKNIYGVTDSIFTKLAPFLIVTKVADSSISESSNPDLFLFDPNTATDLDFIRLGFTQKQIETIRKYQDKIGTFRSKEDFFKIKVISENQKRILAGYISIQNIAGLNTNMPVSDSKSLIDLNKADSIQMQELPGIGAKLSKRIVKYRDLLGGFNSIAQLQEVYGLSKETIQQIEHRVTVDASGIRKLNLNFDDVNELSRHPYLKKNLATQIVKFRSKYGSIGDLSILRDSMILNIDDYDRLKPYF